MTHKDQEPKTLFSRPHGNSSMERSFSRMGIGCCALLLLLVGVGTQTRLGECVTESLTGARYVLFVKHLTPYRGDIISIQGHPVKYVGVKSLAKRVLGLPGDLIVRDKEGIRVESKALESQTFVLLKTTREGKPLTPLSAKSVPEGYVFVAGDNPNSFDSRYEEFGLVPQEKIWGKAIAVFSSQSPVFRWSLGSNSQGTKAAK